jgi:hypothetical protein
MIVSQRNFVSGTRWPSRPVEVVRETARLEEDTGSLEVELAIVLTSIYE